MAVQVERTLRRFTVDEYHRMADAGVFRPDERVELIDGEIVEMTPIGRCHANCVNNLTRLLITRLGDRAIVSPQNFIRISVRSEPQPDLTVLRRKLRLYAAAGIPEDRRCRRGGDRDLSLAGVGRFS